MLGVLGPNGAGKTTAVRVLATLIRPDAGQRPVGGYDVCPTGRQVRALIGLTGQYASVDEDLTGTENLLLIGRLLGLRARDARARAGELLEWFRLGEAAGRTAKTYSGGMRRRLDLAASLVGRPRCSTWTSRPPAWTRPSARRCGTSSAALVADGVDRAAHHAVPGGGRPAGRRDHRDRPRPGHRPRHPRRAQAPRRRPDGCAVRPVDPARLDDVAARARPSSPGRPADRRRRRAHRAGHRRRRARPTLVAPAATTAACRSPSSRCACPSLDEVFLTLTGRPPTTTPPRRRHDHHPYRPARCPCRAATAPGQPTSAVRRQARRLARRSLVQTRHNPEELIDFSSSRSCSWCCSPTSSAAPSPARPPTYLQFRLPGSSCRRSLFATVHTGAGLNTDIEKGVFDRLRSLPIARSAPLAGRIVADVSSRPGPFTLSARRRHAPGLPGRHRPGRGARRRSRCCWSSRSPRPGSRCWSRCWSGRRERCRASCSCCSSR